MKFINYKDTVQSAIENNQPVVALESTVITHGLPYPQNRDTAVAMEDEVSKAGAVPATICIIGGKIHVGLEPDQLETIATTKKIRQGQPPGYRRDTRRR